MTAEGDRMKDLPRHFRKSSPKLARDRALAQEGDRGGDASSPPLESDLRVARRLVAFKEACRTDERAPVSVLVPLLGSDILRRNPNRKAIRGDGSEVITPPANPIAPGGRIDCESVIGSDALACQTNRASYPLGGDRDGGSRFGVPLWPHVH
jgi:hypothetical protein